MIRGFVVGLMMVSVCAGLGTQAFAQPPTPPPKPTAPSVSGASKPARNGSIQPDGMGLRLTPPANWRVERVDPHTILLSGPDGTPDWLTTLTITNQHNPTPGTQGAGQMMADYLDALKKRGREWEVLQEAPLSVEAGGLAQEGRQAVVRFQGGSGPVRQWVLVLPRTDIAAAHVILYTAPDDLFDRNISKASALVDTMVLLPSRR